MGTYAKDVTLSLGLVTTKVRLEPVKDGAVKKSTAFNLGHSCTDGTFTPIKQRKWCEHCNCEVDEPVKLRAIDGGYAVFTEEEVKGLKDEALISEPKTIKLTQHDTLDVLRKTVPAGAAYYIYTSVTGNDEALGTVAEYVRTHPEKTLMSVVCLRSGSEHLARLTMVNDHLSLEMLLWPEEVMEPRNEAYDVRPGMMELMEKIADSMSEPFDPDAYRNNFRDIVAEAERTKMPGEGSIDASELPTGLRKRVTGMDLMSAMEAYVEQLGKE
jgi:non-homologous end joining protein Ku